MLVEAIEYETMAKVEDGHWWYVGMRQIARAWLDPLPHEIMWHSLDAGCGTGGNVNRLLNQYGIAHGLDLHPLALELAHTKSPNPFVRGSVLDLPFTHASLDLVTSFEVLYHRAVPDEITALREVWRVLKPNGYVLLRMPSYSWLYSQHDQSVHTRRRYVLNDVRAMLEAAQFTIERISYINSIMLPLAIAARIGEKVRGSHASDSAMTMPNPFVNTLFTSVLNLEATWFKHGGTFPWGLSILALARKSEIKNQKSEF